MWSVLLAVPVLATLSESLGMRQGQLAEREAQTAVQMLEAIQNDPLWKGDDVVAKLEQTGQPKLAAIIKAAIEDPNNPASAALKKFANDVTNEVHISKIHNVLTAQQARTKAAHTKLLQDGAMALMAKSLLVAHGISPEALESVALRDEYDKHVAAKKKKAAAASFVEISPDGAQTFQETASMMEQDEKADEQDPFAAPSQFDYAGYAPDGYTATPGYTDTPGNGLNQFDYAGNPTPDGSLDQLTDQLENDAAESDVEAKRVIDAPAFSLLQSRGKATVPDLDDATQTRSTDPDLDDADADAAAEEAEDDETERGVVALNAEKDRKELKEGVGADDDAHGGWGFLKGMESKHDLNVEVMDAEKKEKIAEDEFSHFKAIHGIDESSVPKGADGKPDYLKLAQMKNAEMKEDLRKRKEAIERKTGKSFDEDLREIQVEDIRKGVSPDIVYGASGGKLTKKMVEEDEKEERQEDGGRGGGDDDDDDDDDSLLERKALVTANMRKAA